MTLHAAADALESLAAGQTPFASDVMSGALALQALVEAGQADVDLVDAVAGLETLATAQGLDLDASGRAHAAELASKVRAAADRQ